MFGSTVAIPLLLAPAFGITNPVEKGWLIATMFFVSGLTTLLQTTFGNRLPIVQGGTFSFLAPTMAICSMAALATAGWEIRMQHVQGAIIAGSFFEIIIGASGLMGRLLKYVGPITIAPTIALIGLALFKFGAPDAVALYESTNLLDALSYEGLLSPYTEGDTLIIKDNNTDIISISRILDGADSNHNALDFELGCITPGSANIAGMGDCSVTSVSAVPVPAAAWLFGSGIIGLAGLARRK